MQVNEIMTKGVECIAPETSLKDAAIKMRELNVGLLPICGHNDRLQGMLTDRDIVIRGVAEGQSPDQATAESVMSKDVVYCMEDDDIRQAAELMEERQIRRLVVLNEKKRLVGVLSLGDLAAQFHNEELVGEALGRISEPSHPHR